VGALTNIFCKLGVPVPVMAVTTALTVVIGCSVFSDITVAIADVECSGGAAGFATGKQTCTPSGPNYGKMCMKTSVNGMEIQGCDGSPDVPSLCELAGNPKTCCKIAATGQKIICQAADFSTLVDAADFENCSPDCQLGTPSSIVTTTSRATSAPSTSTSRATIADVECSGAAAGFAIGKQTCTPSGPNYGKMCMKTSLDGMLIQGCDGSPDVPSLCELAGNPKTCCKIAASGQKIICQAADFSTLVGAADFENCSADCQLGAPSSIVTTTSRATSAPSTSTSRASSPSPTSTGGAAIVDVECSGAAAGFATGKQTCTPSGPNYGKMCMKTSLDGVLVQGCDGSPGVASLCELAGNPTTCCGIPVTGQKIICKASDFSTPVSSADFASCSADCRLGVLRSTTSTPSSNTTTKMSGSSRFMSGSITSIASLIGFALSAVVVMLA